MEIHVGDIIRLTPRLKKAEKSLHLTIVLVPENVTTAIKWDQLRPREMSLPVSNINSSEAVKPVEPVSPIITPFVKSEQQSIVVTSPPSNRKRTLVEEKDEKKEMKLFLVPLGHDMSSIRRKMLADKAERFGARIVNDIFAASHIVVSQQVSTVGEVSSSLGVDETKLRSHIEEVGSRNGQVLGMCNE
jgi:hypothetical protein